MAERDSMLRQTFADKKSELTLAEISNRLRIQVAVHLLNNFSNEPEMKEYLKTLIKGGGYGIEPSAERMAVAALRKLKKCPHKIKESLKMAGINVTETVSTFEKKYKGQLLKWKSQEAKTDKKIRDEIKRKAREKEMAAKVAAKLHNRAIASFRQKVSKATAFARRLPETLKIRRR